MSDTENTDENTENTENTTEEIQAPVDPILDKIAGSIEAAGNAMKAAPLP